MKAGKKRWLILLGMSMTFILNGCGGSEETVESEKLVHAVSAEEKDCEVGIHYIGIVKPKDTKNYAFLSGGKIDTIYVEKGQRVTEGDILATCDTAISTIQNNINTLTEALNASSEALGVLQRNVQRFETLYAAGDISQADLESVRVQLSAQRASHAQLENDLATAQKSLDDATLKADMDGIVMEIPFKEGEVAGAGYPVVILKSDELVVEVGISTEDYGSVSMDKKVWINDTIEGQITAIAAYPDTSTRVYETEIQFSSSTLSVGDAVDIFIVTGVETGYFVPVESLFQEDGLSYVFIISEEGRLVKNQVEILGEDGTSARILGLSEGMSVVADGVKLLHENEKAVILEGGQ